VKERNNLEDLGLDRRIILHLNAGCDGVDWIQLARVQSNDGLFRQQQWIAVEIYKRREICFDLPCKRPSASQDGLAT
jgi:hypothetical protein